MVSFRIYDNADDYRALLSHVMNKGDVVAPRDQVCVEIRNVTITMDDPTDVLAINCSRGLNPRIAAYEALSLISGVSIPEKIIAISPTFKRFVNPESDEFDGAYGPRTKWQIPRVIRKLQQDEHSRQACVVLWRPDDLFRSTLDLACTVYLNFAIRKNKLLMTTHMRSQDLWWGWPYDLFQFTQLQHTIANTLAIEVGTYTHVVDSLHFYSRDTQAAYEFIQARGSDKPRPHFRGLNVVGPWELVAKYAATFMIDGFTDDERGSGFMTETEHWFADLELWRY